MAALGLIGNAVFLLEPSDLGSRIGIYVTLLLASVAFQSVTDGHLPKLQYMSFLECYMTTMNVVLLSGIFQCVYSKYQQWEDDLIFLKVNVGIWLAVHVLFICWAVCFIVPSERKKAEIYGEEFYDPLRAKPDGSRRNLLDGIQLDKTGGAEEEEDKPQCFGNPLDNAFSGAREAMEKNTCSTKPPKNDNGKSWWSTDSNDDPFDQASLHAVWKELFSGQKPPLSLFNTSSRKRSRTATLHERLTY